MFLGNLCMHVYGATNQKTNIDVHKLRSCDQPITIYLRINLYIRATGQWTYACVLTQSPTKINIKTDRVKYQIFLK